jgi:lysophospholipase L1-like esterase
MGSHFSKQGLEGPNQPQFPYNSNVLFIAYLLHFVVPAFLLLDVVNAWWRGQIALEKWSTDDFVGGLSALWLVTGLGALFLSRDRQRFLNRIFKPLLAIYTIYLMLILIEGFAQATVHLPAPIPSPYTHGRTIIGPLDPNIYPGMHGTKTITINSLGFRGPMPPKQHERAYRIAAIGGSSTICTALDDSEEWPHLLMQEMNASQAGYPVWVGNFGVSSTNTVNHLVVLQWLPGIVQADMWIFLVGVNDLSVTLGFEGAPTQAFLEKRAGYEAELPSGTRWRSQYPYYRRLQILRLSRRAAITLMERYIRPRIDRLPYNITVARENRAAAPVVSLPDLHTGLEEYRGRLLELAARCRALEVRCLFMTQPSMWRSDLSPAEQHLLWFGAVGRGVNQKGYISVADLAQSMDAYNRLLLDVCQQNGLECYDLASHVPQDSSSFYDDVHFNESGARVVAEDLKRYLLSRPPFAKKE